MVSAELDGLGAELPREAWRALLRAGVVRRFATGTVLARQGEPGAHVFALAAGRVKTVRAEPGGTEILLAVRGPGEVIGVIAAIDGGIRTATVTAIEPVVATMLSADRFRGVISQPHLHDYLLRHLLARHRETEAAWAELAWMPTLQRVARVLLRHASPGREPPLLEIGLTQHELALAASLSRSALAADLAELRRRGLIATGRRRIEIRDVPGLVRIGEAAGG
jgi:CRP/FNR family cyclic AMP-dependent transcriptional regulator